MKILVLPVNYNSYRELGNYLSSLDAAARLISNLDIDVMVADNSTNHEKIDISLFQNVKLSIQRFPNIGYFGGALSIYNSVSDIESYEYVFISNVDVTYSNDFFKTLYLIEKSPQIGWLAPQIWSKKEQRDRNPKILSRYSKKKINLIRLMWQHPILHKLYSLTFYKRKKFHSFNRITNIYAGHGSFIILTKSFIKTYHHLHYPIFLFGEEIFLAELCRKANLRVEYCPALKIIDEEHISTSAMKTGFYYDCNRKAIEYIIEHYYEQD